jgi:hypothetical protein
LRSGRCDLEASLAVLLAFHAFKIQPVVPVAFPDSVVADLEREKAINPMLSTTSTSVNGALNPP